MTLPKCLVNATDREVLLYLNGIFNGSHYTESQNAQKIIDEHLSGNLRDEVVHEIKLTDPISIDGLSLRSVQGLLKVIQQMHPELNPKEMELEVGQLVRCTVKAFHQMKVGKKSLNEIQDWAKEKYGVLIHEKGTFYNGRKIMDNVEITFIEQLKDEYPEVLTGEVPETNDVGEQSSKPKLEVVNA